MKPTLFRIFYTALLTGGVGLGLKAQTLYTPSGAVGTSSNSYVGVGTSAPAYLFDVVGGFSHFGFNTTSVPASDNTNGGLAIGWNRSNGGAEVNFYNVFDGFGGANTRAFVFSQKTGSGTYADLMTITGPGNVGIGVSSPSAKLQVGSWNLFKDGTWGDPAIPDTVSNGERFVLYEAAGWKTAIGMGGNNDLWFQAHTPSGYAAFRWFAAGASTSPAEVMRIMTSGNVGIGTTNPTYKLSVNGTIRAKEIIVDTGWSDYVFTPGYRLAPLSEVECHIKAEGHLPGIPSAAEVADRGVSMGEMQSKILAKIEELTLHIIAQEKRIRLLEAENTVLQLRRPERQ